MKAKAAAKKITVEIRSMSLHEPFRFELLRSTKLNEVFVAYEKRHGIASCKYLWYGVGLDGERTPKELGVRHGSVFYALHG